MVVSSISKFTKYAETSFPYFLSPAQEEKLEKFQS